MKYMKMDSIKIKHSFAATTPKAEKLDECRRFWNTYHKQDRYIVIDNKNTLVDGYIQYLVLKEKNVEVAEVHHSNKKKEKWFRKEKTYRECTTTYIYGVHPNSKDIKERVWRVPNSWWQGWVDSLNIGDMMLVHTKHGLSPIRITRIEISDRCPVDIPVKTVVRKIRE